MSANSSLKLLQDSLIEELKALRSVQLFDCAAVISRVLVFIDQVHRDPSAHSQFFQELSAIDTFQPNGVKRAMETLLLAAVGEESRSLYFATITISEQFVDGVQFCENN